MSENTTAAEATTPTHTKKSHYHLSKKVAQLIKVIVQLNSVNENYAADKKRLIDAHDRECKAVKDDADVRLKLLHDEVIYLQQIKHAKNESDEKIKTLQEEVHVMREVIAKHAAKENESYELLATVKRDVKYEADAKLKTLQEEVHTMRELISKHAEREKELHELLATVKRDAKEGVEELKRNQEHEIMSQAQIVKDMSHRLEEQSRQHQAIVLRLRSDLAGEHTQLMENLREEITSSYADEILLLKSRHEKNIIRLKSEALEQGKLAVDAAVAKTRQENEEILSRELSSCVKKSEEMKSEAINMVRREKELLEEELERVYRRADEIPILKEKLDLHNRNETMLQSEVTKLQNRLDSVSADNQSVILGLRQQNTELCNNLQSSREAGEKQLERNKSLEIENNELKLLLNRMDAQKTSAESELKANHSLLDKERQLSLSQLDECKSIIKSLQEDVDVALSSSIGMVERLSVTTAELGKYKRFVQQTLAPLLQIVKRDAHQAKREIAGLAELFSAHVGDFFKWKQRLTSVHANETASFLEREKVWQDENNKLHIAVESHRLSLVEATNLRYCLEKKIELATETAQKITESARVAIMGERLSWERALEDTKQRTQVELERIYCKSREEADNLKGQIAGMRATLKEQTESHDRKFEIMAGERQQKLIEIQRLSQELAVLNANIASKERDIVTLVNTIDSLRAQQIEQERSRRQELDILLVRHQNQLDESSHLKEQLRRKYEESAVSKKRIGELMIIKLKKMNCQLDNLRSITLQHIGNIKQEWNVFCDRVISVKLKSIKWAYDATVHEQKNVIEQLRTAAISFDRRLAAEEKNAQDAKTMLFNTIRESEAKLARALRCLSEDHKFEIEALVKAQKRECENTAAKLEQKSEECEFHLSLTAEKDRDIVKLKKQLADAIRSFEKENRSMALQHDTDRRKLIIESNGKVASIMEDFAKEKSKILSELQAQINAVEEKLQAANDRWNSRPSLQRDLDEIKSLQDNIRSLTSSENDMRARMLYYKRELENRESSYNKTFFPEGIDGTAKKYPLRVINEEPKPKRITTKARSGGGASQMKKCASTSKLPKVM